MRQKRSGSLWRKKPRHNVKFRTRRPGLIVWKKSWRHVANNPALQWCHVASVTQPQLRLLRLEPNERYDFINFSFIVSFCRKRRFMRLQPNRQNRLNQTISRFFQALLTYNTLDRFLILCNEHQIYLKSCANIMCLITKKREKLFSTKVNFIFSEICANGLYRLRGCWMICPMIFQWPRNLVRSKTRRHRISETKTGHLQNLKDLPNVPEDPSNR